MESESEQSLYQYTFTGGDFNSYYFTTAIDIVYEIRFIPSTDFFGTELDLSINIFEMTISVADNPTGRRLPADPLTAPTIFAIFEHFFLPQRQAIVFICDSSDGRERARFRKFGLWFYNKTYSTSEIAKIDRVVVDDNTTILLSLIMSRLHPQLTRIVDMFMHLGEEEK